MIIAILKQKVKPVLFLSVALMIVAGSARLDAASNKDVILVLDTSLSMVGYQGKDIMDDVKRSVYSYVDSLQDGDRVTFVTFDVDVKIYPQMLVDDQNDRDIIKKYISMTEAKGEWTYTLQMLKKVFSIAEELQKSDSGRNLVIVIMTDGLDDPPPGKQKEGFDLKKIAEQYSGNDWWIYLVNLAEMKKSGKISKAQAELQKELSKVSENTRIIDGAIPDKAINEDLKKDIEQKEAAQNRMMVFGGLGLLVLLVLVFLFLRVMKKPKITGTLEYWCHELLKPEVLSINLGLYGVNEISVGRAPGSTLKIRELEAKSPFIFKAVRSEGGIKLELHHAESLEVEFKNREAGKYIENGDIFAITNYSFRYTSS